MVGSDRSANFVIKAKDAATGPLGKVGGAMGKLKRAGVSAFKAIAAASVAAASALAAFTVNAIKGAIEDEKAQARLNATLRARGLLTEKNTAAIQKAIEAGQRLAFTDDDVRRSIENATQFTDKFSKALKIQAVAQDLAAAKGIDLGTATTIVGKAFTGNGKALKAYGIDLQKTIHWTETKINKDKTGYLTEEKVAKSRKETIKGMQALSLITQKFGGIAEEVANTNAVKLEAAVIALNEEFESFGAKFLPAVAEGLRFFSEQILPKVSPVLDELATIIGKVWQEGVEPLAASFGELLNLFNDADFSLLEAAFVPVQLALDAMKIVIEAIVAGIKFIQGVPAAFQQAASQAPRAYQTGGYARGEMGGPSSYLQTATRNGMSALSSGYGVAPVSLSIGTKAQSELGYRYGQGVKASTGTRTGGR